jgi:hypothetical protein
MNHEELRAVRPTLITNDTGDKQRVASQFTNGLNLHFPNARGEGRHGDAERSRPCDWKRKVTPVDSFLAVIFS